MRGLHGCTTCPHRLSTLEHPSGFPATSTRCGSIRSCDLRRRSQRCHSDCLPWRHISPPLPNDMKQEISSNCLIILLSVIRSLWQNPRWAMGRLARPLPCTRAALYAVWRSGSRHGSNKLPTARLELGPTQSTYIACGSMAGASCLEGWRHKRRISQAISHQLLSPTCGYVSSSMASRSYVGISRTVRKHRVRVADAPLCTQVQTHEQLGLSGSDSLQNGKCGLPLELPAISAAHLYASSWHAFCVPINARRKMQGLRATRASRRITPIQIT